MKDEIPVTEADLHAFIDHQLSPERRAVVTEWLLNHPEDAARVEQYQLISDQLHANFDPIADQEIPDSLMQIVGGLKKMDKTPWLHKGSIAASLMLVGILTGWFGNTIFQDSDSSFMLVNLVKPAAFAHNVYTSDSRYPVEIKSKNQSQLIEWLSDRLRTKIKAPNLASMGYRLIGGRLIPSTNRMAAQFMYEYADGKKITLYVRRVSSLPYEKSQSQFNQSKKDGVHIIYWRQGEMGYAVSGALDDETLNSIAKASREQISI